MANQFQTNFLCLLRGNFTACLYGATGGAPVARHSTAFDNKRKNCQMICNSDQLHRQFLLRDIRKLARCRTRTIKNNQMKKKNPKMITINRRNGESNAESPVTNFTDSIANFPAGFTANFVKAVKFIWEKQNKTIIIIFFQNGHLLRWENKRERREREGERNKREKSQ